MSSKGEKDRAKQIQERCQSILVQLLKDEDNKYCVDCDAKGPRWASWNLGIFLCIRCAGIHRNLGVHISKVKSVNLDTWTPEQVVSLQQMGNSRARAVYEANLPDSFRRPQNDSALEAFIRAKYEHKKYIAKEWVPQPVPKVNWDKEIDEEMERQKKKKKSTVSSLPAAPLTTEKKYPKSDTIPQPLPKPKSSISPKLGRTPPSVTDTRPSNGAADLLGLNTAAPESKTQDDIFSNFFSAQEKTEQPPTEPKNDLKTEEQNFFNQAAPTEKEKSKMTKDSILALYSQSPSNLNQFSGVSTGLNQYQYQQPGFAAFPPAQNGQFHQNQQSQSFNNFNQSQSQFNPSQGQFNQSQAQFNPSQAQFSQSQAQFSQSQPQFSQPQSQLSQSQSNQFSQFGQFPQATPAQSQPFAQFGTFQNNQFSSGQPPQPLSQQLGNLNLGQNSFSAQSNIAGNGWQ